MGVLLRIILATFIYLLHYEEFFGGDAITYDFFGYALNGSWHGDMRGAALYQSFLGSGAGAWGMLYIVAGIYEIVGRNMFAIQLINASIGSATAMILYYVAQHLFENRRVSRITATMACFFPSLILWSSQALKDAFIVFFLALSILMTLRLIERIKILDGAILAIGLIGLLGFRFYIFYMMVAAVVGAFVIGSKSLSAQSLVGRFILISLFGLLFTWFGVLRLANSQFEKYGNLESVQRSRADAAKSADSGFGKDVDVGTTEGALTAIPMGVLYFLFAPFPWQLTSLRQSITLPEMIVWWSSIPFLILGVWYALRHKLRQVTCVFLFTTMLTLVYSLFQGNVGTAYRQRSQLLVFYFIFVAVGFVLMRERSEDLRRQRLLAKQQLADQMAERRRERLQTRTTPLEQS
jgi:4-amino-4-deoxy-L-arabinose transferase-like glycosyltransferase